MGKKTKRKENRQHLLPPLTFFDNCLYLFGIILSFIVTALFIFLFGKIQDLIAFGKDGTVFYYGTSAFLFTLPFLLYLEISALIVIIMKWENKTPIFGSKSIRYGEYPYREDCVPLFRAKKYPARVNPSRKKRRREVCKIWCTILLVPICLLPFGMFGRVAIYEDNRIEKISPINTVRETYTEDDYSHLTIQAKYVSQIKGADYWKYEIKIKMTDGSTFTFSNQNLNAHADNAKDACLDRMLAIKELFDPESITIKGAKNIDKVADYLGMTEEQYAKLNKLFS